MLKGLKINFWLLGILVFVLLLRLPSFFEPHWYGDEEIYLVLAQMMRRGAVLYRDIWDNKTPLLYAIYAISPTLLWAKLSAAFCVIGTVAGSYLFFKELPLLRKESSYKVWPIVGSLLIGTLLSIPLFEGTIANAELYFTLPIVLGAYLIFQKKSWLLVGILAATAFLIKVPAIFDFAGLLLAYFVINRKIKPLIIVAITFLLSFLILTSYFLTHGALADFISAAFSQNASYVAVGSGALSKLSNPLFVKGLFLLFSLLVLFILFLKKRISNELLFFSFWFGFSLYGALLSNRSYMHYLLQVVPPFTILILYLVKNFKQNLIFLVTVLCIMYYVLRPFVGAFALDSRTYYQNFFDYISERKSWEEYASYFDTRTLDYYEAAQYINHNTYPNDPIFVWGDVASVYVISQRPSATKFIQAHHLTTIPAKNYDLIMERLVKFQPKYILISKIHFPFPKLEIFVAKNYRPVTAFGDLSILQSISLASPQTWSPNY